MNQTARRFNYFSRVTAKRERERYSLPRSSVYTLHCRPHFFSVAIVLGYMRPRERERARENQSVAFVLINVPPIPAAEQQSPGVDGATFSIQLDRHSAARTTRYYAERVQQQQQQPAGLEGGRSQRCRGDDVVSAFNF